MTSIEGDRRVGRPRIRYCGCGCGERVTGRRGKLYVNDTHRHRGVISRQRGTPVLPKPEPQARRQARTIEVLVEALRAMGTKEAREALRKAGIE